MTTIDLFLTTLTALANAAGEWARFLATPAGQKTVEKVLADQVKVAELLDQLGRQIKNGWEKLVSDLGSLGK